MRVFTLAACLSLFFAISNDIFCQEIRFLGGVGYGSYSMKELKDFQKSISYRSIVTLNVVQSFPPYYNWFFGGEYVLQPHVFGIKVNGQTTGGRSTYTDYSGRVDLDMVVSEIAFGPTYKFHLLKDNQNHNLSTGCDVYLGFSQLELHENTTVYDQKYEETIFLNSIGAALFPNIQYRFGYKFAHFGIELGYWLGIVNGAFKYQNSEILYGNDKINANWSGYRIRLEIALGG